MIAKKVLIHLASDEWGHEKMWEVAREAFVVYPETDVVEVYEHAGWFLMYLPDGTIVGTANDRARLNGKAAEFWAQGIERFDYIASIRRDEAKEKRVKLTKAFIDEVFAVATRQDDALVTLYRAVFPEWDQIKEIKGWPACSQKTATYLCGKFMELDRRHHPNALAGGLWMNNGFSSVEGRRKGLPDWVVERCEVVLQSKPEPEPEPELAVA